MDSNTVLGVGSGAVVIVPEAVEAVSEAMKVKVVENPHPSIMTYDLTQGAYNYIFTVGDLITTVAILSTITFLTLGLYRAFKGETPQRRKEDN